jgi:outer membrane scaffolding protein for murein synthesis (MipA/OmpV family)
MLRSRLIPPALIALLTSTAALAQTLPSMDEVATQAFERPKWEAGLAAVSVSTPAYPASDDRRQIALPVPYFAYRGRVLRTSEEDSRLRRQLTPHVEIGFSGGGALSSNSSQSKAREGMPDLDWLIELGPNLRLGFDGPTPQSRVHLDLPVRAAISLGSGLHSRGYLFAPELAYVSEQFVNGRLSLRLAVGADFATEKLHDYFYAVAPQYATSERPAYDADAGYMGASLGVRATYQLTRSFRGFVALRYFNFSGSANEDSPLFERDESYSSVLGFTWSFWQSKQRAVQVDD